MAKSGLWMRGARGKVAGSIFRKGKGATIQSELVIPKNPQTQLQMAHRILFATVAQARTAMSSIVDHSFEKITDREKSLQYFTKKNLAILRAGAAIDFEETPDPADSNVFTTTKGISTIVPNRYLMSEGSARYTGCVHFYNFPDVGLANVTTPDDTDATKPAVFPVTKDGANYKFKPLDLIKFLFGLSRADQQLTLCTISNPDGLMLYTYNGDEAPANCIADATFSYGRLILKQAAIDADAEYTFTTSEALVTKLESYFDMAKSSEVARDALVGALEFSTDDEEDAIDCIYSEGFSTYIEAPLAACLIFSQQDGKKWKRSRSFMVIATPKYNDQQILNFGLNYNACIDAWFSQQQIAESRAYLSQGGSSAGNFQ